MNESEGTKQEYNFLQRLGSYSIVSSTIKRALTVYESAKYSNSVLERACTVAERSVKSAVSLVGLAIVERYDEQLKKLDSLCMSQLDAIEQLAASTTRAIRSQYLFVESGLTAVRQVLVVGLDGLIAQTEASDDQTASEYETKNESVNASLNFAHVSRQLVSKWYNGVHNVLTWINLSFIPAIQNQTFQLVESALNFDPFGLSSIELDTKELHMDFDNEIDEEMFATLTNFEWLLSREAALLMQQQNNFQRTHAGRNHVIQRKHFRVVSSSHAVTINAAS